MFKIEQLSAELNLKQYKEKYVNVEKFLGYCNECPEYGANWSCPPFDFDPNEIWDSYEKLKVIVFKYNFSDELLEYKFEDFELERFMQKLQRTKVKLMNVLFSMEDSDSLALGMGPCNLCVKCTREFGMPCKMPFKLRYSIESLGGNVDDMVEEIFDIKVLWPKEGKLPPYILFVGGLLYEKIK